MSIAKIFHENLQGDCKTYFENYLTFHCQLNFYHDQFLTSFKESEFEFKSSNIINNFFNTLIIPFLVRNILKPF